MSTPSNTAGWLATGASVRGASHVAADHPSEDSVGWWQGESGGLAVSCVAVADGHGSPISFRSAIGARLAVDLALEVMPRLATTAIAFGSIEQLDTSATAGEVLDRWRSAVSDHLSAHPMTEAELATVADNSDGRTASERLASNPYLAYGATFVAAAATPTLVAILQLGDGDALTVAANSVVGRPLPPDPRLIANETTSLSTSGKLDFRSTLLPIGHGAPVLVLVSTDGYVNSFEDDDAFMQIGPDLLELLRDRGLPWVHDQLEGWLDTATREGSGDDISLGLLWRQSSERSTPSARGISRIATPTTKRATGKGPAARPTRPEASSRADWLPWVIAFVGVGLAAGFLIARIVLTM